MKKPTPSKKKCPKCNGRNLVYGEGPAVFGGAGYYCIDCGAQVRVDGTAVTLYRMVVDVQPG